VAAAALALATSIKVWPLFFFPYLAARKEWRMLAGATALTAVLTFLPAVYLGPGPMVDLLSQWGQQEFLTQTGETQVWYPSQSLRGVLMRYLTEIDYTAVPDSEYVRELASTGYTYVPDSNYALIHFRTMDPAVVRGLWMTLAAMAYAGLLLLAYARRHDDGWAVHGAAWCGLVLLQPFTQKYALAVLLWPALVAGALIASRQVPLVVKLAIYLAAALIMFQPFLSGSPLQREMQVWGLDFLATSLLGATMAWAAWRGCWLDLTTKDPVP